MAKNKYWMDELNFDESPTVEEMIFFENRRKQHLHLIIAQILGVIAGIALVWAACQYGESVPLWEIVICLLAFSVSFMVLFRLVVRVFQKLRMALGRRIYDAATGQVYIVPRNILAGFLSYVVAGPIVASASSYIGNALQFALDAEGMASMISWVEAICAIIMLLLMTVYLLYRDIDYVRTAGVGSAPDKIRKTYLTIMAALALVTCICAII